MHEYSIVQALIDRVEDEARRHGAARVDRVHVCIGALAGVEVELLETAYSTFRERTICEGADLQVERVPAEWSCTRCQSAIAAGGVLRCPRCGAPARLVRGDEIVLARIEMEVPHV